MGQPCSLTLFSHLGNGDDTSSLSNSYVQLPTRMFHGNGPSNPEAENTISTCHWVGEEAFQEGGVSCPVTQLTRVAVPFRRQQECLVQRRC